MYSRMYCCLHLAMKIAAAAAGATSPSATLVCVTNDVADTPTPKQQSHQLPQQGRHPGASAKLCTSMSGGWDTRQHFGGHKQTGTQEQLSKGSDLPDHSPRPSMQPGMTIHAADRLKDPLLQLKSYTKTPHRSSLIQRSLPLAGPNDHMGPVCREKTAICMAGRLDLMP